MTFSENIIQLTDWSVFESATGSAGEIGGLLRGLLHSEQTNSLDALRFQIENLVVSQGSPYNVAISVTKVLVASLYDSKHRHIRIAAIDLLTQIVLCKTHYGCDVNSSESAIVNECFDICKQAIWLLLCVYHADKLDCVKELLALLGAEPDLLEML